MLEVGLHGVCAYVENKLCPKVVGIVILLSEPSCLSVLYLECQISFFFFFFLKIYACLKKRHTGCKKNNRVKGMLWTPVTTTTPPPESDPYVAAAC